MKFIEKLVKWSKCFVFTLLFTFFSVGIVFSAPNNLEFKKWCEITFEAGAEIYEAYRTITFDIRYVAELRDDYWQTPLETRFLGKGDCEDKMILFSSLLPPDQENVKLLWGFVYTRRGSVVKHVWGRLISRKGQEYTMLNFSNVAWDGIVLSKHLSTFETVPPMLVLSQSVYNKIWTLFKESKTFNISLYNKAVDLLPEASINFVNFHDVFFIFELLHGVVSREN